MNQSLFNRQHRSEFLPLSSQQQGSRDRPSSLTILSKAVGTKKLRSFNTKVKQPVKIRPQPSTRKIVKPIKSPNTTTYSLKDEETLTNISLAGVLGTALVVSGALVLSNPYAGQKIEQVTIEKARLPENVVALIRSQGPVESKETIVAEVKIAPELSIVKEEKASPVVTPALPTATPPPPPITKPQTPPPIVAPEPVKVEKEEGISFKELLEPMPKPKPVVTEEPKKEITTEIIKPTEKPSKTESNSNSKLIFGGASIAGIVALVVVFLTQGSSEDDDMSPKMVENSSEIGVMSGNIQNGDLAERPTAREWIDNWRKKN